MLMLFTQHSFVSILSGIQLIPAQFLNSIYQLIHIYYIYY